MRTRKKNNCVCGVHESRKSSVLHDRFLFWGVLFEMTSALHKQLAAVLSSAAHTQVSFVAYRLTTRQWYYPPPPPVPPTVARYDPQSSCRPLHAFEATTPGNPKFQPIPVSSSLFHTKTLLHRAVRLLCGGLNEGSSADAAAAPPCRTPHKVGCAAGTQGGLSRTLTCSWGQTPSPRQRGRGVRPMPTPQECA